MRSIIQIAGRVLRHRDIQPKSENILLLNQNIKQLRGCERCFNYPGFELKKLGLKLSRHALQDVLERNQYHQINAIERVMKTKHSPIENLVALEHEALLQQLFKHSESAKLWWKEDVHWCGVMQKLQPFRKSVKDEAIYLLMQDDELKWQWKNEEVCPPKMGALAGAGIEIKQDHIELNPNLSFWFDLDPKMIYEELAQDLNIDITEVAQRFGEIRLVSCEENDTSQYKFFKNLGIYKEVK